MNTARPLLFFAFVLLATPWCVFAVSPPPTPPDEPARPNFLFIAVDDLKTITGHLSEEPGSFLRVLYPDPAERAAVRGWLTPNLDRLASEGVAFTRAAAPSAVCNPSRIALLTGIPTHRNGITTNDSHFRESADRMVSQAITLPEHLRSRGYLTAGIGKVFHHESVQTDPRTGGVTVDWPDTARSWDVWINAIGQSREGPSIRSPWVQADGGNFDFGAKNVPVEQMDDFRKADLIARLLETGAVTVEDTRLGVQRHLLLSPDQPFFLACGLYKPHLPWYAPKEFLDRIDPDRMAVDRVFFDAMVDDLRDLPAGGLERTEKRGGLDRPGTGRFQKLLDHGTCRDPVDGDLRAWREAIRHYLAATMVADRAVGRLLDGLAAGPYANNTIVVLWSDHGWHLGTKYRMSKFCLWDESTHCVLMIKDPRRPKTAGRASRATVNLIDLYRTIGSLAAIQVPEIVAGLDFSVLLSDPDASWDHPSLTTQGAGNHSLNGNRFRYLRYGEDPEDVELYDLTTDPFERTNLASSPAFAPVLRNLDHRLNAAVAAPPAPPPAPESVP